VVLEAKLDPQGVVTTYDIELLDGVEAREIDISAADGSIVRDRSRGLDDDKLVDAKIAAELVIGAESWTAWVEIAETEAGGVAFAAEVDGDDGVLEIDLLVDGVVWEIEMLSDGSVVKSEESDDQLEDDSADDDDSPEDDDSSEDDDQPEDDDHSGSGS